MKFIIALIVFSYVFLRTIIPYQLADLALLVLLAFFSPNIKYTNSQILILLVLALFSLSMILSALVNHSTFSWLDYFRVFVYLLVVFLLLGTTKYILFHEEDFLKIIKYFVLISVFYSLICVIAFVLFYSGKEYANLNSLLYIRGGGERARLQGFFDNPNYFSFSMFLLFLVSFWMWRIRQVNIVAVGIIILAGLATLSRGYMLGTISFIVFYLFSNLIFNACIVNRKINTRSLFVTLFISPIFLSPIGILIFNKVSSNEKFINMIEQRVNDQGGGTSARLESITNWAKYGSDSLQQVFFGNGANFFEKYSSTAVAAHNSYFRVLGEYGLIALFLFMCMMLVMSLPLTSNKRIAAFSLSGLLSLTLIIFTNDYYLVRDFWLLLFFIYLTPLFKFVKD